MEAVSNQERGNLIIGYTPDEQSYRDVYIYFRWMPLYSPEGEQYLVVMGVTEYSIVAKTHAWISYGTGGILGLF